MKTEILGIDVGGTGIKGAIVDTVNGQLLTERIKIPTPRPALPQDVANVVKELVHRLDYNGPVGCGFPTIMLDGKTNSWGNLHESWLGVQVDALFEKKTGLPFTVVNDADAAGIAEMTHGAGINKNGKVIIVTIGTGLGSGMFLDGKLIPNIELGRMLYEKEPIEYYASNSARKRDKLDYPEYGSRLNFFLNTCQRVMCADLYILGGGSSKYFHEFNHKLDVNVPVVPAKLLNLAGIVGAAMAVKTK